MSESGDIVEVMNEIRWIISDFPPDTPQGKKKEEKQEKRRKSFLQGFQEDHLLDCQIAN